MNFLIDSGEFRNCPRLSGAFRSAVTAAVIPRAGIRRITLGGGIAAERPLVSGLLGVLLIALGLAFGLNLAIWFFQGGTAYDAEAFALGLIPIGAWLVQYSLRKRYVLRISTDSGDRKLAFEATAEKRGVCNFTEAVGRAIPCPVVVSLPSASTT
jgi:hypothetical protein